MVDDKELIRGGRWSYVLHDESDTHEVAGRAGSDTSVNSCHFLDAIAWRRRVRQLAHGLLEHLAENAEPFVEDGFLNRERKEKPDHVPSDAAIQQQ